MTKPKVLKDADSFYKPEIKEDVKVDGVTVGNIGINEYGWILQKAFIPSTDERFNTYANNLISLFTDIRNINRLLVVIKPDNTAKIYRSFPMSLEIRAKGDMRKGEVITKNRIVDISRVEFIDTVYRVDIKKDDKVIWLERIGWDFGLYFNLTKNIDIDEVSKEMASGFVSINYKDIFYSLKKQNTYEKLRANGWFPFIQIIGNGYESLAENYGKGKRDKEIAINQILERYNKDEIQKFTQYWWRNEVFNGRRQVIEEGLDAYFEGKYANCIKNLTSEIEGIMIDSLTNDGDSNYKQDNLVEHIKSKASTSFTPKLSLGFPEEFTEYIQKVFFDFFDIKSGKIPTSRNSVSHGVAKKDNYTQQHALQAILILDQLHFILS